MSRAVEQWVERAQYDIETARAMLKAQRYLYVLFCCQQAIEKALKAVVAKQTNDFPPRTHNLPELAEDLHLALTAEQSALFLSLTRRYIGSRYPQDVKRLGETVTAAEAKKTLAATQEALKWLLSMLE
jgi:HEPN domain-containing protein